MNEEFAPHPDRRLARLAARQYGVVSFDQMLELDYERWHIDSRLRAGRLHRIHQGVFAVGHSRLTREGRWWAGVLAVGDGAVLSHWSAARLWEIGRGGVETVHVSVGGRGGRTKRRGLKVHRPRRLDASDHTVHAPTGIPVTTPLRTIADLAPLTRQDDLEQLLEQAHGNHLIDQSTLIRSLDDAVPPRARKRLTDTLGRYADEGHPLGTARTRSRLERGFLKLIRDHGLPRPLVNQVRVGYEVDFVWDAERLIVETDTQTWHGSPIARATDAHRDAVLGHAGYAVLRLTWNDVFETPSQTAAKIAAALSASR
jgi:very-short-patch-repair endonuclease